MPYITTAEVADARLRNMPIAARNELLDRLARQIWLEDRAESGWRQRNAR